MKQGTAPLSKDLVHFLASNSKSVADLWPLVVEYGKTVIEGQGSWREGLNALEQSSGSLARFMFQLANYDRVVHQGGHNEYFNQGFGGSPAVGDTTHRILADLHTQFKSFVQPVITKAVWQQQNDLLNSIHVTYCDEMQILDSDGRSVINPNFGKIKEELSEKDDIWTFISTDLDQMYGKVLEKALDLSILHYVKTEAQAEIPPEASAQ